MHVQQLKAKQKRSRVPLKLRLARAGRPRTKVVESDEDDPDFVEAPQPSSPVTPARRKTTRKKNGWAKDTLPAPSLFKMLPEPQVKEGLVIVVGYQKFDTRSTRAFQ